MRRTLAALTATAVLVPTAILAAPGLALAATNQLTVTTIGRDGAKVKTKLSVINLATNSIYSATSGKARKLPKGKYVVLANIQSAKDGTDTLGGRTVKASGNAKTTIDARSGRPFKLALNPALKDGWQINRARICAKITRSASIEASSMPGKLYIIPNSSENLQFAYMSELIESSTTSAWTSYVLTGTTKGLPKNYSRSVKRSSLAAVTMNVRRGPAGGSEPSISVQSAASGCLGSMYNGLYRDEAPYRFTAYLSPGKWELQADTWSDSDGAHIGFYSKTRTLVGGKSYKQNFYRSPWGPADRLPHVINKRLDFIADSSMFTDPEFARSSSAYGSEGASKSVVTLTKGGKTLKKQTRTDWASYDSAFSYRLKSAGWYTLNVDAKRYRPGIKYPSGMLSTRSTAKYRFYADPNKSQVAAVFIPRFAPQGLDMRNQAKPGSSTTIGIALQRPKQDPDAKMTSVKPKTVTAKASFDGGKTWRSVPVKHSGGKWTTVVKNPASGVVTLRAKVTDAKGNSSEITVYRAYAIG